ncbi:MAG: CBS domain-containing protein [Candidatus Bathyarchaeia archaeon]
MSLTLKVRDVMEKGVITLDGNLSAKKALEAMLKNGVWSVVVSDKGLPSGVVTERDLLRRAVVKDRDLNKVQLKEIMSSPLITIEPDASFGRAWELMVEKGVRRLYVIEDGKIIGRVTQTGMFQKLLDALLVLSSVRYSM